MTQTPAASDQDKPGRVFGDESATGMRLTGAAHACEVLGRAPMRDGGRSGPGGQAAEGRREPWKAR